MYDDKAEAPRLGCSLYNWNSPYRWGDWDTYAFEFATTDWRLFEGDAGTFAFVKQSGERNGTPMWKFLYASDSENFARDVPNHPKWPAAKSLGATHVVIRFLPEDERDGAGMCLVMDNRPPLNAEHPAFNSHEKSAARSRKRYEERFGDGPIPERAD